MQHLGEVISVRAAFALFVTVVVALFVASGCGNAGNAPHATGGILFARDGGGDAMADATHDAASDGCRLRTCASVGATCGTIANGCGDFLTCGPSCSCVPRSCSDLQVNCGPQNDGCGNVIDCGTCTGTETCGGGGVASVCGNGTTCIPNVSCTPNADCGQEADGCGGVVPCGPLFGGCPAGQACGGDNVHNVCAVPPCAKKTCADYAGLCGPQNDGCGGMTADCGDCVAPAVCGGGGISTCGSTCAGVECQQVACDGGATTTLTGTVYDPAMIDPVYNALVYVPAYPANVAPFGTGAQCLACDQEVTGSPVVSTQTDAHGAFTLTNVPAGNGITVVVQLGRWRRVFTVDVPACTTTAIPPSTSRLPANQMEGDIPAIAIATGAADPFECLLERIGIDTAEFTPPGGGGRVSYFTANGTDLTTDAPNNGPGGRGATLWGSATNLEAYDIVLLPCEGGPIDHGDPARANLLTYANSGGRVFTTHFGYEWLAPNRTGAPWGSTGSWAEGVGPFSSSTTAFINTSFPDGQAMSDWMAFVASPAGTPGQFSPSNANGNLTSVVSPAIAWTTMGGTVPVQLASFDTPFQAAGDASAGTPATTCGRVVYADCHVSARAVVGTGNSFPDECGTLSLSNGERLLEFMLFDLSSCTHPNFAPPNCTPTTCAAAGVACGEVSDGCGGVLACGGCTAPETCGGGGVHNTCGTICVPKTCASMGYDCGIADDGCGGSPLECGSCTAPAICGGGGRNKCGTGGCTPTTCAKANAECGPLADGCGNLLQCGTCSGGATCGSGGDGGVNQCTTTVK